MPGEHQHTDYESELDAVAADQATQDTAIAAAAIAAVSAQSTASSAQATADSALVIATQADQQAVSAQQTANSAATAASLADSKAVIAGAVADDAFALAASNTAAIGWVGSAVGDLIATTDALDARIAVLESGTPPPPPPSFTPPSVDSGTWVLQQIDNAGQAAFLEGQIEAALAHPASSGYSIRVPWNTLETSPGIYDPTRLEEGLALAEAAGKPYSIRTMAGRWSPSWIGGPTHFENAGEVVPTPFNADGTTNQVWLDEYEAFVNWFTTWAVNNGVDLVHYAWWGALWAELSNSAEVQAADGYGSGWQAWQGPWLAAHEKIVDIVEAAVFEKPVVAEFPLSGRGPLTSGQSQAIADYAINVMAPGQVVLQMNGWRGFGNGTGWLVGPNGSTDADWKQIAASVVTQGGGFAVQDVGVAQWLAPTSGTEAADAYGTATQYNALYGEMYLPRWVDQLVLNEALNW